MVELDGAKVVMMGFHGLSSGMASFSSRAFILNSEACVTVACGVVHGVCFLSKGFG